jgi:uncharacterized membrane protein YebE (DUF533 family)
MFDAKRLLDQFLGGQPGGENAGGVSPDTLKGLAGGAAAGGLVAILLGSKGGRKLAGNAVKLGGAAILGTLAYKAWRNWQANRGGMSTVPHQPMRDVTPQPDGTALLTPPSDRAHDLNLALIRAMIAAAKADGHIDAEEQKAIFAKLEQAGLDRDAKAFVMDELMKPLDLDSIVALATNPERALEIYAASVLAIDPDDPAEQAYLNMLAARLKLDPGLKASVEAEARKAPATA